LRWSFSFWLAKSRALRADKDGICLILNKIHSDLLAVALMLLAGCEIGLTLSAPEN